MEIRSPILSLFVVGAIFLAACQKSEQNTPATTVQAVQAVQTSGSIPEAALSQIELSYWEQGTSTAPGGSVKVKVGVSNHSDYPLDVTSPARYQMMATWHDPKSYALIGAPAYGPLQFSIAAKKTGAAEMVVVAPATTGEYMLKLQLADAKGNSLESKGVKALIYNITVH
jgi:hypothetical protein